MISVPVIYMYIALLAKLEICIPRNPLATPHSYILHTEMLATRYYHFCSWFSRREMNNSTLEIVLTSARVSIDKFL
jgi:hypothetical protein